MDGGVGFSGGGVVDVGAGVGEVVFAWGMAVTMGRGRFVWVVLEGVGSVWVSMLRIVVVVVAKGCVPHGH